MAINTNQSLATPKRDEIIKILCGPRSLEHLRSLRIVASSCRIRTPCKRLLLTNACHFWLCPRFRRWQYSDRNDLVLLNGNYKTRFSVRSTLVNLISCLRQKREPVVWVLQADNQGTSEGAFTTDVFKSLACQILHLSKHPQTESDASAYYVQAQADGQQMQWLSLLGKAMSSLTQLIMVIERSTLVDSEDNPLTEDTSLVAFFLRLIKEITQRECKTVVKILVVNHSSHLASTEVKVAQRNHLLVPATQSHTVAGSVTGSLPWRLKR